MAKLLTHLTRAAAPPVFKMMGLDVFGHYKRLIRTLNWSPEHRSRWRLERLGGMLEFCWRHVPFYREFWGDHGVAFRRPRDMEELKEYPILSKDVFKANRKRIEPDNVQTIPHKRNSTGGSTGQPLEYSLDLAHWSFIQAYHQWGWGQAGYRFGDPVGVIAGSSLVPVNPSFKVRMRYALERKLCLSGVHMERDLAILYHKRLNDYGAKFLYGYPSVISVLASHLSDEGLALPRLRGVITTAEMLQPRYRANIECHLGVPVFDHFGCNDGGFLSYECRRHRGFHYNDFQAILETDSPDPARPGQLLVTNLWNKSMPFIRYANGDLVQLADKACPCLQPFPMIASVEGRTMDLLTFANGKTLAGPALTLIFRDMEIEGWQVVQRTPASLEVRILSGNGVHPEHEGYIRRVFANHLGDDIVVDVNPVRELKTTRAGKLKPVWSEVA